VENWEEKREQQGRKKRRKEGSEGDGGKGRVPPRAGSHTACPKS